MFKKKNLVLVSMLLVLMLVFTGCASKPAETVVKEDDAVKDDGAKDYKIVLVLPGPINDQGWNATAYAGLQMVEKNLGIKMEYVESVQQADFEATFRDYGEKKYDLVFGHGIQFLDAVKKIAPQYPDTYFMIINSEEGIAPNVGGIGIREWEGGYIAGTIAGMNTTSKKLGAIGSFPFPVIEGTLDAYEAGAKAIDPEISVSKTYVNSWDDISKGKETATAMIESGADVVFCSANQVGLGSIDAAKTGGVKAVGYIAPQNDVAEGTVIASIVYNTPVLFEYVVKELVDGKLKPEGISQGWAEGVLGMQWSDMASEEVKTKVDEVISELKEGKIENPYKEGE